MSVRSGYKQTELGEVPEQWEVVQLRDIVNEAKSGFASGKRDLGGIFQLRMNNISIDGSIVLDALLKVPSPKGIESYLLREGDILFNNTNSVELIGKSAIFNGELEHVTFSNHLTRIRVDTARVVPKWLLSVLTRKWQLSYFRSICLKHVGQAGIRTLDLLSVKAALPPLSEQQKIASILSTVDESIQKSNQIIVKTQRLKAGLVQQLFARGIGHTSFKQTELGEFPDMWDVKSLQTICENIVDCPHSTPEFTDLGVPIIRNFNIRDGEVSLDRIYYTTEEDWIRRTQRCIPQKNDVLFSREAPIGEACLSPSFKFSLGQRLMLLRPTKQRLHPSFLVYAFYSPLIKRQLSKLAVGVTAHHVNVEDIRTLEIALPDFEEQEKIALIISSISSKIKAERGRKEALETLKRGLMLVLLTGKVRVKVT